MHDLPEKDFHDPVSAHRRMARTESEIAFVNWARDAARDRTPDGVRGGPSWYVIRVRPGSEVKSAIRLLKCRIKAFCPRERLVEKPKHGKPKRIVRNVVLPGYLFVQLAPAEVAWAGLLTFDCVAGLMPRDDRPVRMSDQEIQKLQELSRAKAHKEATELTMFIGGEDVLIRHGPFADFRGKAVGPENAKERVRVEVNILGRLTPVEFGLDQVRKLR